MYELSVFEIGLFVALFLLERIIPARKFPISERWIFHWCGLMLFATAWLIGLIAIWPFFTNLWHPLESLPFIGQVVVGYLTYSFIAYWYHRVRHSNSVLWHYVHYMHHAPAHMDTRVTFWRHPVEMIMDSCVILAVGGLLGIGAEVIVCVLLVEAMFEIFHHSNINTPIAMRWVGYFLQLPEQHLIHHERGLHRWNYGTVTLWDTLFGTVRVPQEWHGRVGLPEWKNTKKLLLFRY